jgi:hypothetical protein
MATPRDPSPPPALGPPIIGTDVPGSAPGVPQPVIVSGGVSLPPSFPLPPAGTWLPPPLIGDGANELFPTPVVPPGTGVSQTQPQFKTGSATTPTAASLFPDYSAPGPFQPIVLTSIMQIGLGPPPFTPGSQPIVISTAPAIPQLPWNPPPTSLPINTARPTITGTPEVGQILASTHGTWTSATTYAAEWLRDGSPIAGATAASYTLVAADEGAMISVLITATGPGGEASAESLEVGPVAPAPGAEAATSRVSQHNKARKKR